MYFDADLVDIPDFKRLLFFYEDKLREYGQQLTDSVVVKHLDLALQYPFETAMRKFAIHVKSSAEPVPDYESLWMIHPSVSLAYRKYSH